MLRMLLAAVMVVGLIAVPTSAGQDKKSKADDKAAARALEQRRLQDKVERVFPVQDLAVGVQDKNAKPGKAGEDRTAKILAALHGTRVPGDVNPNELSLMEILLNLTKTSDIPFVIREELFKEEGVANFREQKPNLTAVRVEGMTLHRFLSVVLKDMNAAYLVRDGHIEILPRTAAEKEVGLQEAVEEAMNISDDPSALTRAQYRMNLPLLSVVAQDRSLDQVITELARAYDLNVVISPAAREQFKQVKVNERLLNVPADTMLELLAGLANQDVARKGNTFRIGFGGGM